MKQNSKGQNKKNAKVKKIATTRIRTKLNKKLNKIKC
jgi:hypothetical protein